MNIDDIRQEIIDEGKDPEDYVILINKSGHTLWKKEYAPDYAKLAIQHDQPIKEDVDFVADTASLALMDSDDLATVVSMLMQEVDELKQELEALKND